MILQILLNNHIYLRALKTISNLEIIFGQFKRRQVKGRVIRSHSDGYIRDSNIVTLVNGRKKNLM